MNKNELDRQDLSWIVRRLPKQVKELMKDPQWHNNLFLAGGYIRACIAGENVNDIDLFVSNEKDAELLSYKLVQNKKDIIKTENAYTVKLRPVPVQVIHRWVFNKPEDVAMSFDYTICSAVVSYDGTKWCSWCDERFYIDLAAKRLVYRKPVRNEDAGGSMLRVLKYYQRGYRIPLDSLGAVVARLVKPLNDNKSDMSDEENVARVVTGLLREVDPNVDPLHESHLPSMINEE